MSTSPVFPAFYSHWLMPRIPGGVSESLATCDQCVMVKPSGLTRDPGPFDPALKCCTYFPFIPNFALGSLLSEGGAEAALRLKAAAGQGVLLPLGLFASPEREELVKKAGKKGFGRRKDLLCPFHDAAANGCSIWKHRPGVCASYFCKSERGEEGLGFWEAVESYLNHFEWALANESLMRLGFTNDDLEIAEAVMLTEPGPERAAAVRSAWAEWAGREEEFFRLCNERSQEVTQTELSSILDDEFLSLERDLAAYLRDLEK